MHGQYAGCWNARVETQVNQRDEDFCAGVFGPLGLATRSVPEGSVFFAVVSVAKRVEGLELARLSALWVVRHDRIHRVDFRLHLPAHVRYDAILVLLSRQLYGLRNLLEEIHYGRAPQLKSVRADNAARRRHVAQVYVYLEAAAEPGAHSMIQPAHVEEQELVREGEVFGE